MTEGDLEKGILTFRDLTGEIEGMLDNLAELFLDMYGIVDGRNKKNPGNPDVYEFISEEFAFTLDMLATARSILMSYVNDVRKEDGNKNDNGNM